MGDLMRRYWMPALLSDELGGPDGDPVPLRLLGEDLVAFRDSDGRVGLIKEQCSHRCAPLSYGRNEQGGLRCLYHGWKYDVEGNILETPNEPSQSQLKNKVKHPAYPVYEAGDVLWTYLGNPADAPAPPRTPWTELPRENRAAARLRMEQTTCRSSKAAWTPPTWASCTSQAWLRYPIIRSPRPMT